MFDLGPKEWMKFTDWLKDHASLGVCPFHTVKDDLVYEQNTGASGGALTVCFTPTRLGTNVKIKCACGEEVDVTDYGDW